MSRAIATAVILALIASPLLAKPEVEAQVNLDRMAEQQQLQDRIEKLVEMGMDREAALFLTALNEGGMEPSQLMLMLILAEEGGEEMLPLMLMNNAPGRSGAPAVVDRGDELLIVDGGTLYVIDMTTNTLKSKLKYAAPERLEDSGVFSLIAPLMNEGRDRARQTACLSNLKQIGLGFAMYMQEHDGMIPEENWVEALMPYINNRPVFTCPTRPDLPVAYALNGALLGANVNALPDVGQTVLAFESNLGGDAPVGGADAVPPEGVHEGGINVLFVDGHVKWMRAEAAIALLAAPVE